MARTSAIGLRRDPQPPIPIVMPERSWPMTSSGLITLPVRFAPLVTLAPLVTPALPVTLALSVTFALLVTLTLLVTPALPVTATVNARLRTPGGPHPRRRSG